VETRYIKGDFLNLVELDYVGIEKKASQTFNMFDENQKT